MSETAPIQSETKSTRERILDAAEQLFAERGLAGTAVRDIAAGVGLNPASLYNHFPSKDLLYEAVLERGLQPVMELLVELASGEQTRDTEDRAIDRVVTHLAGSPNLAKLITYETLAGGERLARIGGKWLGPIYMRGIEALQRSRAVEQWEAQELPLLMVAFQSLILGYFAMAPLLEQMFDLDATSPEGLARQTAFLRKITHLLIPPRDAV
ncbi:MAG TPA: TetR/AcrR family transcriptional regulator [Candidatus Limnocylindrales bacterium]|nr:TetR/AcrR family transcriptional regulator [Candidatus Limnocylindrales bacterium]